MVDSVPVSYTHLDVYKRQTQDRNRPITPLISDYTRKSVAAFIEKYPNVGPVSYTHLPDKGRRISLLS